MYVRSTLVAARAFRLFRFSRAVFVVACRVAFDALGSVHGCCSGFSSVIVVVFRVYALRYSGRVRGVRVPFRLSSVIRFLVIVRS